MADETPRHEPASEGARLPSDLAALDRRLETDAALWLTHLPATSRLDEHARALPARLAAARPAASTSGQSTTTITTTQHREPHMQTHIPTPPTRLRTLFAATAALVVVGAIAALLISLGARPSSPASGGPTRQTSQPGPQASHIAAIYTATDIDAGYNPVHVTSTFQKGQTVYVVMQVRGLPKGEQHFVNVSWLLNGKPLDLPPEVRTGSSIKGDSNTYFAVPYPQAGQGTAKIYWDLPNSDASSPEDLLAWTVNFTVTDGATPAPGDTPTPMPTPTLSGTQVPAPTPNGTPIPPTPTVSGPSATPTLPPPR